MLKPEAFFNKENYIFEELFNNAEYVWDGLKNIKTFINNHIEANVSGLSLQGYMLTEDQHLENSAIIHAGAYIADENISIGAGTIVEPGALIKGPAIIGKNCEIRHGAYIRGDVIIGDNCVVGHATEIKHSVMMGNSKAGHFAYIGDSILGKCNLGAGTKLANLKINGTEVVLNIESTVYQTGLRKFGAILGDGVETGCNSVTSPGAILSKGVWIYPGSTIRGFYGPNTIVKLKQNSSQERY